MSRCNSVFFAALAERLQIYSNWSVAEFRNQNNNEHRHRLLFEQTTEPNGFIEAPGVDADQINYLEAWQFEVSPNSDWRIHGLLVDDTFYLVWLDPDHQLTAKGKAAARSIAFI